MTLPYAEFGELLTAQFRPTGRSVILERIASIFSCLLCISRIVVYVSTFHCIQRSSLESSSYGTGTTAPSNCLLNCSQQMYLTNLCWPSLRQIYPQNVKIGVQTKKKQILLVLLAVTFCSPFSKWWSARDCYGYLSMLTVTSNYIAPPPSKIWPPLPNRRIVWLYACLGQVVLKLNRMPL